MAVLVVGAIVAVASVVAARDDARPPVSSTPPTRPASASPTPAGNDRIEISNPYGDGLLVLVRHTWSSTGSPAPENAYLDITVELRCENGQLDVEAQSFQLFDAGGDLFDVTDVDRPGAPLDTTTLFPGDRIRGRITFDVPRGDVTLLFSVASEPATALKIPG